MKKMFAVITVLMLAAVPQACSLSPNADDSTGSTTSDYSSQSYAAPLQTAPELRIKDLPVPAGYVYKPDKSMIIEYGSVIAGLINYEGSVELGELIGFYRREMPKYDWTLSSMVEREEVKMIFQKDGKICEVLVRSASGLSKKTVISIYYAPKE